MHCGRRVPGVRNRRSNEGGSVIVGDEDPLFPLSEQRWTSLRPRFQSRSSLPLKTAVSVYWPSWLAGGASLLSIEPGVVKVWFLLGKASVTVDAVDTLEWHNWQHHGLFRPQVFRLPWRRKLLWVQPLGPEAEGIRHALIDAGFNLRDT